MECTVVDCVSRSSKNMERAWGNTQRAFPSQTWRLCDGKLQKVKKTAPSPPEINLMNTDNTAVLLSLQAGHSGGVPDS